MPLKWTSRGQGHCPNCQTAYSTAWKPKNCKACDFDIGGSFIPKTKAPRMDNPDGATLLVEDGSLQIYSVKCSYRDNRVIVVKDGDKYLCHHEKCKQLRSVHQHSNSSFSCSHCDLSKTRGMLPLSTLNLSDASILAYKCDTATKQLLSSLIPTLPEHFSHLIQISFN